MSGWKDRVVERCPRAVVWTKTQPTKRFDQPDGTELGVSMISTGDAWRVAAINIREGTPADKAPGQALLL